MDISKFVEWAGLGDRKVTITCCGRQSKPQVWCYDYDLMAGKHVAIDDDPPTSSMLIAAQRAFLKRQLNHLGGQKA